MRFRRQPKKVYGRPNRFYTPPNPESVAGPSNQLSKYAESGARSEFVGSSSGVDRYASNRSAKEFISEGGPVDRFTGKDYSCRDFRSLYPVFKGREVTEVEYEGGDPTIQLDDGRKIRFHVREDSDFALTTGRPRDDFVIAKTFVDYGEHDYHEEQYIYFTAVSEDGREFNLVTACGPPFYDDLRDRDENGRISPAFYAEIM